MFAPPAPHAPQKGIFCDFFKTIKSEKWGKVNEKSRLCDRIQDEVLHQETSEKY
jgi:hypothetical protein